MKNEQKEEAKTYYFQTNMSKIEIANAIGVSRRTILRWCKEDNWEKLRQSSRHMPAIVAEKCYYLIDTFTSRLLQDPSLAFITLKDAQTIHLLATSIKKLKNRSTINESMEMFNFFLEGLKRKDPQLAADVLPEMEEYIAARADREVGDFLMDGFGKNGVMEYPDKETAEQYADTEDLEALEKQIRETGNYEQAIDNWEKEDVPKNPEFEKDNIERESVCLKNEADIIKGIDCKLPTAGYNTGQKSDKNETFLPKKTTDYQ